MPTLSGILLNARDNNQRDGITGALVCRHDVYVQLLEGPAPQVNAAFERISRDDRHLEIKMILSEEVSTRMFGKWAMLHDPAKSVIWTPEEIADGAMETASVSEVTGMFQALVQTVKDENAL